MAGCVIASGLDLSLSTLTAPLCINLRNHCTCILRSQQSYSHNAKHRSAKALNLQPRNPQSFRPQSAGTKRVCESLADWQVYVRVYSGTTSVHGHERRLKVSKATFFKLDYLRMHNACFSFFPSRRLGLITGDGT